MSTEGTGDRLFLLAEELSRDFSLFPEAVRADAAGTIEGVLSTQDIDQQIVELRELDIDAYIERCVAPAESPARMSAPEAIRAMAVELRDEVSDGPFYAATVKLPGSARWIGFIAQDRSSANGVWMPRHHDLAARQASTYSRRKMPVVSLMDTPGAAADAEANRGNQAHAISRLIAEMCNLDVPSVGVVFGQGYSGGAIPLAASNLILSVRDGVFSTIQPKGLASIARRYNLSWQECAKYVGVSPFDLVKQGIIDAVVDYVPGETDKLGNLAQAIITGIDSIEAATRAFVGENPYIFDHYQRCVTRHLAPSPRLQAMQAEASLSISDTPTEYPNVFGMTNRYMRYLGVRKRIHATTAAQYGRLSVVETPEGQLGARSERERRRAFYSWLQDPDRVVYEDTLNKAWKAFQDRRQVLGDQRGTIATLLFGEPRKNFEDARTHLLHAVTTFLYNRWKGDAPGNFEALVDILADDAAAACFLRRDDILDAATLVDTLRAERRECTALRGRFSYEGLKLFSRSAFRNRSEDYLAQQLCGELNLLLAGPLLAPDWDDAWPEELAEALRAHRAAVARGELRDDGLAALRLNRQLLEFWFPGLIRTRADGDGAPDPAEVTVLDVLLDDYLREHFRAQSRQILRFDHLYEQVIANLVAVAASARDTQSLDQQDIYDLLTRAFGEPDPEADAAATSGDSAADGSATAEAGEDAADDGEETAPAPRSVRTDFLDWFEGFSRSPGYSAFLRSVEEWKRSLSPHLADALFVVITFLFDRLLPAYLVSERSGKRFDGRILPRNIGRRKDFWNRLAIAYRDLLIQRETERYKREQPLSPDLILERMCRNFEEMDGDLLSSDPVRFPGFRQSIDKALRKGQRPCGIVTGVGEIVLDGTPTRVGIAVSNVQFQAGAFDMASAEKVCKLLVTCAAERLPVVCFVSSGGMQTKEGAAALFSMAAVNDRITRFVRDNDLPVIVFGFGDCTGGAQASFVTHPLVQTYYFSGTSIPFAGQIVVASNLPADATLANYLSTVDGAMQGLVVHPFYDDLDERLARIDPAMPQPTETVEQVIARVLEGELEGQRPEVPADQEPAPEPERGPVRRALIHARGCTAVKLVRVAQREDIEVVLVQSDPDMESVAVDMMGPKDRAVCIGGNTSDESYLNAYSVLQVAAIEKVDALHPGIGFLSENASFAELVGRHGLNFVGPTVAAMETMGNKSNAISTAKAAGVPVVPGSHGVLTEADQAAEVADEVGYPVLIKAVHGGGGKGIQRVDRRADIHELFDQVSLEARSAFGNGDVYIEKCITRLRHIEVQVLCDRHGEVRVLGLRDCSVQRNKQKIVEESGSVTLPESLRRQAYDYAAALAKRIAYVGAGTVEFIFDLDNQAVYFMEMNTRLQVEHPVTEWTSGVDIVAQQFRIAGGASIADLDVRDKGYALEVRVTAEKLVLQNGRPRFQPDPGVVRTCRYPDGPDVEVISAVAPGKEVPPFYDSLIAQIVVHAGDRDRAIDRMLDVLRDVEITGICTNLELLQAILDDPVFRGGDYDTGFIEDFFERIDLQSLLNRSQARAQLEDVAFDLSTLRIDESDELKVLAPSTGVFYLTPSPSEPEYVSVGDRVGVRQTLCQLEAMKSFTPLTLAAYNGSDASVYPEDREYEITRINVSTGQQVNQGDLLFIIRPLGEAA
jgi:acetyl/propionyl-CoA carboxylase alpha subunit/acetyl-CoA carboxylase beta subunit